MTPIQEAEHAISFFEYAIEREGPFSANIEHHKQMLEKAKNRLAELMIGDADLTSIMNTLSMDPEILALENEYNRLEGEKGL